MPIKHFDVFYSWQSDLPRSANHHFILEALRKVVQQLKKDDTINIIPRLDHDTKGKAGSPNIAETILRKIDTCEIFIADVTLINHSWIDKLRKARITPNPNVLFELGYGVNLLGWERVICIHNDAFSKVERLPFDLMQNRITRYYFDGRSNKATQMQLLVDTLKFAIKTIIENNGEIVANFRQGATVKHDLQLFRQFDELISDEKYNSLINEIGTVLHLSKEEYKLIDRIRNFLRADKNQFLTKVIADNANLLSVSLDDLRMTLATNLFASYRKIVEEESGKEIEEFTYHLPRADEFRGTHFEFEADQDRRIQLINSALNLASKSYKEFRKAIKEQLFV